MREGAIPQWFVTPPSWPHSPLFLLSMNLATVLGLSAPHLYALTILAAGQTVVLKDAVKVSLFNKGYIDKEVCITASGRAALAQRLGLTQRR